MGAPYGEGVHTTQGQLKVHLLGIGRNRTRLGDEQHMLIKEAGSCLDNQDSAKSRMPKGRTTES